MVTANILYSDDDLATTSAIFGKPMQAAQDYIATTLNTYVNQVGQAAGNIVQGVVDRFNEVRSNTHLMRVESLRNKLNTVWKTDGIRPLLTIADIQQAPIAMQRWVMAAPPIRQLYNRGGCSAYEDTYVDIRPGGVGSGHYDYRRVMNGIVHQVEDEEGNTDVVYTNYIEPLMHAEDVLTILEKSSIRATWNTIQNHLTDSDEDPTSELNEKIG